MTGVGVCDRCQGPVRISFDPGTARYVGQMAACPCGYVKIPAAFFKAAAR